MKRSGPALGSAGTCGASVGTADLLTAIIIGYMRYRIIDDIAEDEDVTRLMREREVEADIAEKMQLLIDAEIDVVEIGDVLEA